MSELRLPHINTVVISGRLVRDIELKYTQGGTAYAKFCIAVDRNFQKNNEWEKETSFIDITIWGKRAEQCAEQLHKGSATIVEGYVKTGKYVNKEGVNIKTFEIVAHKVNFLEKSSEPQNQEANENTARETMDRVTDNNSGVPF